jgi:hypothetical protein
VARVTTSLYVSALIRRVTASGGFAAIVQKGAEEAGAIHVAVRHRDGTIALFSPAPQQVFNEQGQDERKFMRSESVTDDDSLASFCIAEKKFDPDYWLVELEGSDKDLQEILPVMKP